MKKYLGSKVCKRVILVLLIPLIAALNMLTNMIATYLNIPFFIDTWATSLGAILGGLPVAMAGGVLYNLIMSQTFWPAEFWVFMFSSIWVAVITYVLFKKGLITLSNPFKLIMSGAIIGFSNAILVLLIHYLSFGFLPTYAPTEPTYNAFLTLTGSSFLATVSEKLLTEFSDKVVSIFIAVLAYENLPRCMRLVCR